MPTRAATAAAAAASMRTTRSRKVSTQPSGKENTNANTPPPSSTMKAKEKAAPKKPAKNVKAKKSQELFCSCRGVDDGTPMVQCGTCFEWSAPTPSPFLTLSPFARVALISFQVSLPVCPAQRRRCE